MEEFLSTLLHFQHFRQFINGKIEQLKNQTYERDLFDREVMFYEEGVCTSLHIPHTAITTTIISVDLATAVHSENCSKW